MRQYLIGVGCCSGLLIMLGIEWLLLETFGPIAIIPMLSALAIFVPAIMFWADIKRDVQSWRRK